MIVYQCYAKVNFTLEVVGRRPDGLHHLASLAHSIRLADWLEVHSADDITCESPGLELPGHENLVYQAARLLAAHADVHAGVRLVVHKRISVAAGLGGGSSDAAAALLALDRHWRTHLGIAGLQPLAARLGSDVSFFLRGGAAVIRGRGDEVESLPAVPPTWLVLTVPPHDLTAKTATLYAALREEDFSDGAVTARLSERLRDGQPPRDEDLVNAFARAARSAFPGLDQQWRALEQASGRRFHLSGAGPALFSVASDRSDAQEVAGRLGAEGVSVFVTRTVRRGQARLSRGSLPNFTDPLDESQEHAVDGPWIQTIASEAP